MKNLCRVINLLLLIIFTFFINIISVFALNIKIDNISVTEKSGNIELESENFNDNNITNDIIFNNVNDYVTYKIILKNDESKDYLIDSIVDNNRNDNINISYKYDDNKIKYNSTQNIYVTLKYNKKLVNKEKINLNDLTITLNLIDSDGNSKSVDISPNTGDNIIFYIILFIVALIILFFSILLIKRRKNKKLMLFLLCLIPGIVFAKTQLKLDIKFTNITINGEMLPYKVTILDEKSNITERTILYGNKVGELPQVSKNGYDFDKYVDQDNNEVTSETIVTKNLTISPKFNIITYNITYNLNDGVVSNPTTYTVEDEFVLNNPDKQGYSFSGWTGSNNDNLQTRVTISKGTTGDLEFNANFSANDNTKYTVIHKYPNLNDTYSEVNEELYGTTGSDVTPALMEKEGFTGPNLQTVNIKADGSTLVTYIYTRNKYNLILENSEYIQTNTPSGEYYYDTPIQLKALEKEGYTFSSWSNGETSIDLSFNIKESTTIGPIYDINTYTIKFDSLGGTEITDITKNYDEELGTLPIPTKKGYAFDGWYTDEEYSTKISSTTKVKENTTYYAKWIDLFPIVFLQEGACTFNGANDNITGEECSKYTNTTYIDTNVNLYSVENYYKDFEVGFDIVWYDPTVQSNESQITLVSSKIEVDNVQVVPGFVFRIDNKRYDVFEITQTINNQKKKATMPASSVQKVKIIRKGNILYYSINDGNLHELQNMNNLYETTDNNLIFGATLTIQNTTVRHVKATLSNMYIRLGKIVD